MCCICVARREKSNKSKYHRRHRSCSTLYDAGKWLPVGIITALLIYSYYVYVVVFSSTFVILIFSTLPVVSTEAPSPIWTLHWFLSSSPDSDASMLYALCHR